MEWIKDIIKEYVKAEQITTTEEKIDELSEYYIKQGYGESLGIVCAALYADRKTMTILKL